MSPLDVRSLLEKIVSVHLSRQQQPVARRFIDKWTLISWFYTACFMAEKVHHIRATPKWEASPHFGERKVNFLDHVPLAEQPCVTTTLIRIQRVPNSACLTLKTCHALSSKSEHSCFSRTIGSSNICMWKTKSIPINTATGCISHNHNFGPLIQKSFYL